MENKIKELIKKTKLIGGWLSPQEGVFLYKLASKLPDESAVVEIGSWKGKSTVWLGSAVSGKKGAKVYAVDSHVGSPEKIGEYGKINTFSEFKKNIRNAGLNERVIAIKEDSAVAAKNFGRKIDLLFIDGSHEYTAAKKDFLIWSAKLKPGAWVVIHDATVLPGPWKVARDGILLSSQYENTGMLGSMIFGQFVPTSSKSRKIGNLLLGVLSCIFAMSYVKLRKIPFPKSWRKTASKINFKRSTNSITHV